MESVIWQDLSCAPKCTIAEAHVMIKEVFRNENDISAKEEIQSKGSWISCKNEHSRWKKGSVCKKSKRKKGFIRLGRSNVTFSFYIKKFFRYFWYLYSDRFAKRIGN